MPMECFIDQQPFDTLVPHNKEEVETKKDEKED